jgi:hypothetical protein
VARRRGRRSGLSSATVGDGTERNDVLQALLQRKLRRPDQEAGLDDNLVGREDPLTSTVFERLTYLPLPVAWSVIGGAVRAHSDSAWPATPPTAEPEWRFWPSLQPAPSGRNVVKVEPDVLLRFDRQAVLFEMKHWGTQSTDQWHEQVLAVQHGGLEAVAMVAVGGRDVSGERDRAFVFACITNTPLFTMSWTSLRDSVRAHLLATSSHERRVLRDVEQALTHWGYGPPTEIGTLVGAHRALFEGGQIRLSALDTWTPARGEGDSASGGLALLVRDVRQHRLGDTRDLSAWSPR